MAEDTVSLLDRRISRRSFLEVAAGGAIGGVIGTGLLKMRDHEVKSAIGFLEDAVNPELYQDIINYRRTLGYTSDLLLFDRATVSPDSQGAFLNSLPESLSEHGDVVKNTLDIALGENATRFVKEVKVGESAPSGIFFNVGPERSCNISYSYSSPAHSQDFLNIALHEAIGHGTDPDLTDGIFSFQNLIQAEHGRWKMVAQSFSVPDQFFQHEYDQMKPFLERELGAAIAWTYRTQGFETNIRTGQDTLQKVLDNIAHEEGKSLQDLKFNKRISKKIGNEVLALVRSGDVQLTGGLQQTYEANMDTALFEMYAEMMKLSITSPEVLQGNPEILEGCEEVLSAIQQKKVDLQSIREQLRNLKIESVPVSNYHTVQANEFESDETKKQDANSILANEQQFQNFASHTIDAEGDSEKPSSILSNFSDCYAQVLREYPELIETYTAHLDEAFDPELDIWEIKRIEWAMDSAFVRESLKSEQSNDSVIKEKTDILREFINSSAFNRLSVPDTYTRP